MYFISYMRYYKVKTTTDFKDISVNILFVLLISLPPAKGDEFTSPLLRLE